VSKVVSLRLRPEQWERLQRMARWLGRTPSEASVLLLEEALRAAEFGFIQFRNSPAGRQAYVLGTSLAVWEVAFLARFFGGDADRLATHLGWPPVKVKAALAYAEAYPEEVEAAIADNERGPEPLRRALPALETVTVGEA
jgi:uncharacterized protein (DUF433 family)